MNNDPRKRRLSDGERFRIWLEKKKRKEIQHAKARMATDEIRPLLRDGGEGGSDGVNKDTKAKRYKDLELLDPTGPARVLKSTKDVVRKLSRRLDQLGPIPLAFMYWDDPGPWERGEGRCTREELIEYIEKP